MFLTELKFNNTYGQLGSTLTSSTTTITFTAGDGHTEFPTLTAGQYVKLVFEPGTPNYEIVYLTAYTAGSLTGTITRAAESASVWPAVGHAAGVTWANAPTTLDFASLPLTTVAPSNDTTGVTDAANVAAALSSVSFVRTESVTGTAGNATITDANCVATDVGLSVTGTNIPLGAVVISVNPGVSFVISAPPTAGISSCSFYIPSYGVQLLSGEYWFKTGVVTPYGWQSVIGPGSGACGINVVSGGSTAHGIYWHNQTYQPEAPAGTLGGFTIRPTYASRQACNGIHWGDIRAAKLDDIFPDGFIGNQGAWLVSTTNGSATVTASSGTWSSSAVSGKTFTLLATPNSVGTVPTNGPFTATYGSSTTVSFSPIPNKTCTNLQMVNTAPMTVGYGIWGQNVAAAYSTVLSGNGERSVGTQIECYGCAIGVAFDCSTGNQSFDYSRWDIKGSAFSQGSGSTPQTLVQLQNGVNMDHLPEFSVVGNITGTSISYIGAVGLALGLPGSTTDSSFITGSTLSLKMETSSSGYQYPLVIQSAARINRCGGVVDFNTAQNANFVAKVLGAFRVRNGSVCGLGLPSGWAAPNGSYSMNDDDLGVLVSVPGTTITLPSTNLSTTTTNLAMPNITYTIKNQTVSGGTTIDTGNNSSLIDNFVGGIGARTYTLPPLTGITLAVAPNGVDWVVTLSPLGAQLDTTSANVQPADHSYQIAGVTATADITAAANAGVTHSVIQAEWSSLQPTNLGAALDATAASNLKTSFQNAITYGPLGLILDPGYQYAPTWVIGTTPGAAQSAGNVEQFTDQGGNLYSYNAAAGNAIANWVFSANGRTYMTNYTTALLNFLASTYIINAYGQYSTILSNLQGIRLGGLGTGELHFPQPGDGSFTTTSTATFTPGVSTTLSLSNPGGWTLPSTGIVKATSDSSGCSVGYKANSSGTLTSLNLLCGTAAVSSGTTWTFQSIWGFGSIPQTGTNATLSDTIASDQVVCPLPGYVPFVGGGGYTQSVTNDTTWTNWWTNSLLVFEKYLLNMWSTSLSASNYSGAIWVLHADKGIRAPMPNVNFSATVASSNTAVFPSYLNQMIQGSDHVKNIAVYGSLNGYPYGSNVYPDCTWIDEGITNGGASTVTSFPWQVTNNATDSTATVSKAPTWWWILQIAQANGVAGKIIGENTGSPVSWGGVFTQFGPMNKGLYWGVMAVQCVPSGGTTNAENFRSYAAAINKQRGNSYVYVATAAHQGGSGETTVYNNTSSYTHTLPQPASGAWNIVINVGSGQVTVATPSGSIYLAATGVAGTPVLSQGGTSTYHSDGTNWYEEGEGTPASIGALPTGTYQTINANGTLTAGSAGVYEIGVVGGGGGGGGGGTGVVSNVGGGGGGAGAASIGLFTLTAGQVITYTIGAGGAAGTSALALGNAGGGGGQGVQSTATGTGVSLAAAGGGGGQGGLASSTVIVSGGVSGSGASTTSRVAGSGGASGIVSGSALSYNQSATGGGGGGAASATGGGNGGSGGSAGAIGVANASAGTVAGSGTTAGTAGANAAANSAAGGGGGGGAGTVGASGAGGTGGSGWGWLRQVG